MGDANPIRTLGDYSKPSHEGYRNTIELPVGNNVVPLRSDTIWLVQKGCSFHGLRSEDPNQHLKDFLKLVDSFDLDGSITTWEDLTTHFLAQFFPPKRISKLRNDILMFQQHQAESLSEAWTRFKDLLQKVPHHGIGLWLQDLALYDNESWNDPRDFARPVKVIALPQDVLRLVSNFMASQDARLSKFEADLKQQQSKMTNKIDTMLKAITDRMVGTLPSDTVKNSKLNTSLVSMGIGTEQAEEPKSTLDDEFQDLHLNLPVLKVLAHAPIYNAMLDKYVESLELGKTDNHSSKEKIVKDVEVHIGKLKLLNDFYVIDMKKDPKIPLLVGRGFLTTANAVINCRKAKIAVGEGITRESYKPRPSSDGIGAQTPYYARKDFLDCHLPGEWEIVRDAETNPFKDVLVFRRMVEFLGALPINLKGNMWESEDLIKNSINWDKPPKDRDGPWHAKIRIIDPDGEEFTKTLQSIPTTRKLSERESPREILNLDHFYDT
ncbi:MAK10-like protein [Tanacetum coccineum]